MFTDADATVWMWCFGTGSLRLGQYTILQLEKDPLEDKWCVSAVISHQLEEGEEDDEA